MKKKKTKVKVKKRSTEDSNLRADDPQIDEEMGEPGFDLPVYIGKLLISKEELKEEINKII